MNSQFTNGKVGLGFSGGIIGNFPIDKTFVFSLRLGYNELSGKVDGLNPNNITQTLDASLHYVELTPVMQFHNLLPIRNVYFLAGVEFDMHISKKYLINGVNETDIPDAQFRTALALGLGYVFKLTPKIYLAPEISYRYPFTNVSSNANFDYWKIPQLRFGISLTFAFGKESEIEGKDHYLNLNMKEIRWYDKENNFYPLDRVKVEDMQYTELFPLVPYVFCEVNSSTPKKGTQTISSEAKAEEFNKQAIEPDAMSLNIRTLDIIGSRMQQYPDAELTITGTNDKKQEVKNKDVASQRAQFAKDYLISRYKINPERINVRSVGLPDKPSSSNVPEGIEENRRIEFSSSNPRILEPILIQQDIQRIADPDLIEFIPEAMTLDSITYWQLELAQGRSILKTYNGTASVNPVQWNIPPNELRSDNLPIEWSLTASTNADITKNISGTIPIDYYSFTRKKEEQLADKTISKFSLILFDFDKADISLRDMEVINNQIIPAIKFNSTVKIYGYTDIIGDDEYNRKLALRRAESVKKVLADDPRFKSVKFEVFGVGENDKMFDNNSPVGRHLSRTVQVYVITPR
jgi:outer membrane protein OmpA-like peptidoglycan-associated protein